MGGPSMTKPNTLLADRQLQGSLVLRVLAYWCFYMLAITQILLCWRVATGPDASFFDFFNVGEVWSEHGVVLLASFIMLPVMLWDVLRITKRSAGSIFRLKNSLHALADGEPVQPIQFRAGDQRDELAEAFNDVLAYVNGLRKQLHLDAPGAASHDDELEVGARY